MEFLQQYITRLISMIAPGDIINPAMEPNARGEKFFQKKSKYRRSRKLILIGFLGAYALIGWLRLRNAFVYWDFFDSINLRPSPLYLTITGAAIGFLFTLAVILVTIKIRIGSRFSRWLAGIFLIWFWIDRILFSTRETFFNQLGISLMITAATIFWALILIRKKDMTSISASPTIPHEIPPTQISNNPAFSNDPGEEQHVEQT